MAEFQARVVLPYKSGLPQDVSVNTWNFISASPPDPAIAEALKAFYNYRGPGGDADNIATFLHNYLDRTTDAARTEFYEVDLATGEMGSPFAVDEWTLATGSVGADGLPLEVALCSSIAATVPPGINAGRRKGRIFVGPLNTNALDGDDTGPTRPTTSFTNLMALRMKETADALLAVGAELAVWSRADAAFYPIVRGWVDDSFDTQRRRGIDPAGRTTWVPEGP